MLFPGMKPPGADTKPATVTIFSPEIYAIYETNSVSLVFNVSVGESTADYATWIQELYYKGDWQEDITYVGLGEFYRGKDFTDRSSLLPPQFSINLTNIPEGKRSITVYANEKSRHIDRRRSYFINSSSSVHFTIDNVPLNISVLQPVKNKTYDTSTFPLKFIVSEPPEWISYSLDGQLNVTKLNVPKTGNTTLTRLSNGMHSLAVYAKDTGGKIVSCEPFYFTVDTTSPSISLLTTENKTYDTTDIPLNFAVNETVIQISYSLDGQENITVTRNMTLTGLSEGSHYLTVYAKDAAGNIGNSGTVYFSIEQKTELIILGSSFPIEYGYALVAVIIVALVAMSSLLFLKHKKQDEKNE